MKSYSIEAVIGRSTWKELTRRRSPKRPEIALLPDLPEELVCHYRELLRTYVIMGSGNLSFELRRFADLLVESAVNASETMRLHIFVLEELVQGLGTRSSRHVMTRADLLALEIMIHLAGAIEQDIASGSSRVDSRSSPASRSISRSLKARDLVLCSPNIFMVDDRLGGKL